MSNENSTNNAETFTVKGEYVPKGQKGKAAVPFTVSLTMAELLQFGAEAIADRVGILCRPIPESVNKDGKVTRPEQAPIFGTIEHATSVLAGVNTLEELNALETRRTGRELDADAKEVLADLKGLEALAGVDEATLKAIARRASKAKKGGDK